MISETSAISSRRRRWWSLSVASLATLIVTTDTGQLSIALPVITKEFAADLTLASWLALVYALVTASLYLPCGRLSDRRPNKRRLKEATGAVSLRRIP